MKATDKAYGKLESILNKYGFEISESAFGNRHISSSEDKTQYVSIQVVEKHDRYENTESFENFRGYGHLEVSASICRMGGEMTAEDFAEAAAQMKRAGELLKEIETADLSYRAMINGEAAE